MKSSEIHALHDIELVEKLKEARQEAFNLRLRHATGELENSAGLSRAKKDVARLLTIASQRNIDLEREQSSSTK
ncbi:MAG: 50S ribosomal protein L29 [Solirubrobacterales bacterium]|nr:50S ribosomal protein L29 [Solirubrobacterales bacterium]